mmetsp:Transcript_35683/g.79254  ORF Transcript_35683/g.79254 Transcript_35683/m.79254 type:complete len:299 (-) Transcript_35683:1117-2013(-)
MSSSSSSRTPSKRKAPVDRSITSSKKNRLSIVGQGSSSAQPTPSRRNRADESDADAASVDHDVEWDWSATRVLATRAHDYTVPTPQRVRHPEDEDASVASSEAPAARPSITASRGRRSSMGSTAVPAVPAAARRSSVGGAVAAQFPLSSEPDREQLAAAATAAAASAAAKAAAEAEAAAAAAAEAAAAAAAACLGDTRASTAASCTAPSTTASARDPLRGSIAPRTEKYCTVLAGTAGSTAAADGAGSKPPDHELVPVSFHQSYWAAAADLGGVPPCYHYSVLLGVSAAPVWDHGTGR